MLIADDNRIMRVILREYFEDKGYDVTDVTDGEELVGNAREGGYGLIVSDDDMPRRTGLQALREIRTLDHRTPFYLLSADDVERQAREAGATGYISKIGLTPEILDACFLP